jgi:hypothetical protein
MMISQWWPWRVQYYNLGCDDLYSDGSSMKFQRNILPPSSRSKGSLLLAWLTLWAWKLRQYIPLTYQCSSTRHHITFQKIALFNLFNCLASSYVTNDDISASGVIQCWTGWLGKESFKTCFEQLIQKAGKAKSLGSNLDPETSCHDCYFFVIFFSLSRQVLRQHLKVGHNHFLPHNFQILNV